MGAKYYPIKLNRNSYSPFSDLLFCLSLAKLLFEEKPDILVAYTVKPVIYGCIMARILKVDRIYPIITGLGHVFISRPNLVPILVKHLVRRLYKVALKGAGCVFFQNNDDKFLFKSLDIIGPKIKAVRLMGSGVDLEYFKAEKLPRGKVSFLMVSRPITEKGLYEYIEASRSLQNYSKHAKFSLLGPFDGNPSSIKKDELDAWINLGIIEYLGEVQDVRPHLKNCTSICFAILQRRIAKKCH